MYMCSPSVMNVVPMHDYYLFIMNPFYVHVCNVVQNCSFETVLFYHLYDILARSRAFKFGGQNLDTFHNMLKLLLNAANHL